MSAAEIIEQIKALPPEEQHIVAEFFDQIHTRKSEPANDTRYVAPERARELSAEIFAENAEMFRKLAQ